MNKTYGGVCPKCGETKDGQGCKCYRKMGLKSCPTLNAIIEKQYKPDGLHYLVSQQELYAILTDITELEDRCEKLEVQLAGCLTAAEGWNQNPAKKGDYGWSLPYQKTLELRRWADKHSYCPESEEDNG